MTDIEYLKKYLESDNLESAIKRLENGEPVQYIIGNVDFYGYKIKVNNNVLIPRFETEELVENTLRYIDKFFKDKKINLLDIGTGSGCISIALKKENDKLDITASDISKEAIKIAKENAIFNNADIKFINTNLYENINEKFDIVISNPPYISYDEKIMEIVKNNEPDIALYAKENGLYFYKEILKNINEIINEKYLICFEIGMTQAKEIEKFASEYLNNPSVIVKKDLQGRDRMIFIHNFE